MKFFWVSLRGSTWITNFDEMWSKPSDGVLADVRYALRHCGSKQAADEQEINVDLRTY